MIRVRSGIALGTMAAVLPLVSLSAQTGSQGVNPGVFRPPRTDSRPMVGFGSIQPDARADLHGSRNHIIDRSPLLGHRLGGFGSSLLLGSAWAQPVAVPVPTPVPYPVPYPFVRRVRPARSEPAAPPRPYNPENSKTLMIAEGADGGGGVMIIERTGGDSLQLTWRGTLRPVREARLFLADSTQRVLESRIVAATAPAVVFEIARLEPRIAYTGLTVVHADGSTATTLVPWRRD